MRRNEPQKCKKEDRYSSGAPSEKIGRPSYRKLKKAISIPTVDSAKFSIPS